MSTPLRVVPLLACLFFAGCASGRVAPATTLVVGARLVDGTGSPARMTRVRLRGARIEAIGELQPRDGEHVVDAAGLVLAPGFIDTHSHHDGGLADEPEALAAVSQGITTIVVGQDGGSAFPLSEAFDRLRRSPPAVNVASFVGHGTLRGRVMGEDYRRVATAAEVAAMRALLREELAAGALGLSSGLEYDPGIYATTEELIALAREAGRVGGRYFSHMRSEDRGLWKALDELIRIGREADVPVHVSHVKLAMRSLWGRADELLARLEDARASGVRVTADCYPYTYWQSTLTVLFPDRDFTDRSAAEFALRELAPADGMLLSRFEPEPSYVGLTIAEIARLRGSDPVTTYIDLIAEAQAHQERTGEPAESVIGTSMDPADVARLLAAPGVNVCSDGGLRGRHPRGFGAFPRVLAWLVRERGVLSLEEAVHKMTAQAAASAGIAERGVVRPGAFADLVLFDPDAVEDRATVEDPLQPAAGVEYVWVNGVEVYTRSGPTGARPGRVVRRGERGDVRSHVPED